jgi:hypothetical protein
MESAVAGPDEGAPMEIVVDDIGVDLCVEANPLPAEAPPLEVYGGFERPGRQPGGEVAPLRRKRKSLRFE